MTTPSLAELKSFRKALSRWKEDMNDKAEELEADLKRLEERCGGKPPKGDGDKPPKGDGEKPPKGDKGEGEEEEEEEDDDTWP